jgi:type IV pilus assembly protein PilC
MATSAAAARKDFKEHNFVWEGKDKTGKLVKGEMRAAGENVVTSTLRRQGVSVLKVKRQRMGAGGKVTDKDVTFFTRQLATMMKAGVPLLQAFDIVGKGHANPAVAKLLMDIKGDVETGTSLSGSFQKYPLYFDALFCKKRFSRSRARSRQPSSTLSRLSWSPS